MRPCLDLLLLGLGVALLGSRDNRRVDDLPAHGEKTRLASAPRQSV